MTPDDSPVRQESGEDPLLDVSLSEQDDSEAKRVPEGETYPQTQNM